MISIRFEDSGRDSRERTKPHFDSRNSPTTTPVPEYLTRNMSSAADALVRGTRVGLGIGLACSRHQAPLLDPTLSLGNQVVREARELLSAVLGHDEQVLEPAAAEPGPVETGLDREDLAALQLFVADHAEHGQLVHLEPDAVPERVEEALLERLP